jgi:glycine cleavage system aminomethyltransferase T/glycine/D-amino acid oxidase-like deaminating enzyme
VPEEFRAIVIGGGVSGASIAYHLAELGWNDTLLLERGELTSGSTFHSAGLVGQLRSSVSLTRMMMYSVELYGRLSAETGVDPGWHEVGSLRLAASKERIQELQRLAGWSQTFGLPLRIVSTDEALEMWPLFDPKGVEGAAFLPTDGHLDPTGLTIALAEGAKRRGVVVRTGSRVSEILVERGRVQGVRTGEDGEIRADVVVNAGGIFANQIGHMAGVEVPVVPFAHQYLLTKPIEGVTSQLATMRDPDRLVYFRPEAGGGLVMGGYERNPAPWAVQEGPPPDFNNRLLDADWPRFEQLAENAQSLVPAMQTAEVVTMINGPEAFTPDGEFILGESDVRGFFVAAGFCAHGIAGAGGIGKVMADWIAHGEPEWDLWKMDVRRFGRQYRSRSYARARAYEVYATYYDIHYPGEERRAGRPLKTAPTYARLAELGAEFGEKSGWERANWFRSNEDPAYERLRPRGWAGEHWSTAIAAEHVATRERAALFDESSFAKIAVEGPAAAGLLQRLCANDVDREVGAVVYTQMLNSRGGIECDLTVTRLGHERFLLVTGSAFGNHDLGWIRKQPALEGDVRVADVTGAFACFGLWGPKARDVLASLTPADLSNDAFPYMSAREIVVGDVPCWALRVTYVGELGWELYPSTEYGLRLFDSLLEAGRPHGVVPAGYRAIDSLRLEKGYRAWGVDITPEENPFEAGLGFAVRMDLPGFIGNEALERAQAAGVSRKLTCLVLDDPRAICLGNEPVFHDGAVSSRVTSGGIGYTLGRSIAYAYLPEHLAIAGTRYDVEVFGERVAALVADQPLWDPKAERIRA